MNLLLRLFGPREKPEQRMLVSRLLLASLSATGHFYLTSDLNMLSAFVGYIVVILLLSAMQWRGVGRQDQRLAAVVAFDAILAFAVMIQAPAQMAVFYPVLLWMTLSNGFRFGLNWLLASSILSSLSFGAVVLLATYWQQNLILGSSLTFALLAIPAYCSTLIRNISHAKEEADLASKAKSYFLASVSHELRTPLNAIIGYGNHLRQSNMPRGQKDMVEASVLAGEHLLHLIEQLIDVAKAGTGKTEVKRTAFRATDLMSEIRDIMAGRVAEKGLAFHFQAEPFSDNIVEGPVNVIRNILLNLVGNAAKFTEAGSITVSCGFVQRHNKNALAFTVADTGIGIAESAKELIFQPFQQADETVMNRFGGTGLGLSICRQLVEQVDGTITVDSQIGQGSLFKVEIPVDAVSASAQLRDIYADAQINILGLGRLPAELLEKVQAQDNLNVRHIACDDEQALLAALDKIELQNFHVAMIPEYLARDITADKLLWALLAEGDVAPILVKDSSGVSLRDFTPAFTSVLMPEASNAEIRSAVHIGRAFSRKTQISSKPSENEPKAYTPKRVLVADDNRTNRNVLAAILELAGHHVTMATDGDEALVELEKGETDILLLDVNMPRLSGIDASIMWRQAEAVGQHLPIIGVTADATAETETKCLQAGMDLRLTKPVDAELLLTSIEEYCGQMIERQAMQKSPPNRQDDIVVPIGRDAQHLDTIIDSDQIAYLRSIGDQNFVNTMIESFLQDIEQTLEPMRNAVKNNNASEFRFCAHAFKSSGNNMGARSLSHLCGQLEKISDTDFAQSRLEYLAQIEHETTCAVAALKTESFSSAVPVLAQTG